MTTTSFDPDALREKYREERDKRLRADGNEQYVEVTGEFAHYLDDPYVEPGFDRAPAAPTTSTSLIIGGGFGGLLAGARLREAGVDDIRIIEKGGDFGGTWYWNRYPGAACDIESYIYLPLLEEIGYIPKEKYSPAAGDPRAQPGASRGTSTSTDDALLPDRGDRACAGTTRRGALDRRDQPRRRDARRASSCMANGPLNRPKLPGIPGIETFKGHTFHTSRWDYDYTGGDSDGDLTGLADKRVGIIGTGATAVQCVPHLGACGQAALRVPAHAVVDRRARQPADRSRVGRDPRARLAAASAWRTSTPSSPAASRSEDLVDDGWTDIIRNLLHRPQRRRREPTSSPEELAATDGARRLREDGADPRPRRRDRQRPGDGRGAEALVPPVLQAAVLPRRVPRHLQPAERAPGRHRGPRRRAHHRSAASVGATASGVRGRLPDLRDRLRGRHRLHPPRRLRAVRPRRRDADREVGATACATLHGMHSRGFPNCFIISITQSGFTANFPHMLNEQSKHIAYILAEAQDSRGHASSKRTPTPRPRGWRRS